MKALVIALSLGVLGAAAACAGSDDEATSGGAVAAGGASGASAAGASGAGPAAGFPGKGGAAGAKAGAAGSSGAAVGGTAGTGTAGAGTAGAGTAGTGTAGTGTAGTGAAGSGTAGTGTAGGPPGCFPVGQVTTDGGGRCADLHQAWTARGINVGYYAFRAKKDLYQYSGDYTGNPGDIFAAGPSSKGVTLQKVPMGAYVGLSSTGPWYDPPSDCLAQACGTSGSACKSSAPPLRATISAGGASWAWGYAYSGASHMQGWFAYDPDSLEFAGFDPSHPCALGPAGLDFEVDAACGMPTACKGTNITCGKANPCNEGADDCGATSCGAMSGGPLTAGAWKRKVAAPSGVHACSKQTPHPSIQCFANGSDQDFFLVYPFGAYLYWAQNSTTKHWLHYGDSVQVYFHTRDAQGVLWDFVEVTASGAPALTPPSDGTGAGNGCSSSDPSKCEPCKNGGTCGWVQDVFLQ